MKIKYAYEGRGWNTYLYDEGVRSLWNDAFSFLPMKFIRYVLEQA